MANNGLDCVGDGTESQSCTTAACAVNGAWGSWTSWSACSQTCGGLGTQSRTRSCDSPAPANGGTSCSGSGSEDTSCGSASGCPVHGAWGDWAAWGTCSVTCAGVGTYSRTRNCDNPAPANGGNSCSGSGTEDAQCDMSSVVCTTTALTCEHTSMTISCSGQWEVLTIHNALYGRIRTGVCPGPIDWNDQCPHDVTTAAGGFCDGQASCSLSASNGVWNDPCVGTFKYLEIDYTCGVVAINGAWGSWGSWSTCSLSCGAVGSYSRSRSCDNPAPAQGGADCSGSATEDGQCDMTHILCAVDGAWSSWQAWSSCSVSCAAGTTTRDRLCDNPAPANGGSNCAGDSQESDTCDHGPCPVDGVWSAWAAWSTCSLSCGAVGSYSRTRTCDNPAPLHGGTDCAGASTEDGQCDMTHIVCVIDGEWGTWASWGTCSVTCATGTWTRDRQCDRPAPANGGLSCVGDSTQSTGCTLSPCPVDGAWGTWSSWGACSVTCATGSQTRSRSCDSPAAAHGGAACAGDSTEDITCDPGVICPVDGVWSTWGAWGACSVTCATGTATHTRTCTDPAPAHGGAQCAGSDTEDGACDDGPCPVDGAWSSWGAWGACSVTCENGTYIHERTCTDPAPAHGGADCVGDATEDSWCYAGVMCPIDGEWGVWSGWSFCSVTCLGVGTYTRERLCDSPTPQYNGASCPGSDLEDDVCDMTLTQCESGNPWESLFFSPPPKTPVDGGVGPWQDWQGCTLSCGGGVRIRQRFCDDPVPVGTGADCVEHLTEEEMCNNHACTWNGYAHGWMQGGTCQGQRGLFDCADGLQCIDIKLKCDCVPHCDDASDESSEYAGCVADLEECSSRAGTLPGPPVLLFLMIGLFSLWTARLHTSLL